MPKKNSVLEFSNYDKMINVPWIIYADIEALNVPGEEYLFHQTPSCIYLRLISLYPKIKENQEVLFKGENVLRNLLNISK